MDASDLIVIFSFVFKYSPHRGLLYLLGSSWILVSRVCYSYMRFLLWITPCSFYFDSWSLFTCDIDITYSTCELGWYSLLVLKYLYSCSPDSNWAAVSWDTLVSGFLEACYYAHGNCSRIHRLYLIVLREMCE